jgi:hypothetical protein
VISVPALTGTVYIRSGVVIKILLLIITTTAFYALRHGHSLFLSEFSTDCDVVLPLLVFIILSFP